MSPAFGSRARANEPKPPCRLQVGIAHLSTDLFEKFRLRAVKVNASSICNIPQTNVTITVEIWKTGLLGNHFVWKQTISSPGTTYPGSQVNNFSTYRRCINRTPTHYYGVSYSKALINGKWQFARHILTEKIAFLKCGT
jgi:hypothetical protein